MIALPTSRCTEPPVQVCGLQVPELPPVGRAGPGRGQGGGPGPQPAPRLRHRHHQVRQARQGLHLQPHHQGHGQDHER